MIFGGAICEGSECTGLMLVIFGILAAMVVAGVLCFLTVWWAITTAMLRWGATRAAARVGGFTLTSALAATIYALRFA